MSSLGLLGKHGTATDREMIWIAFSTQLEVDVEQLATEFIQDSL